ncbi:hypothetical protein ACJQWK_08728 [Exserohilum turcicum]|uniref:Rhodopsin domain-containing protein n=1 Tax=Exserohilum turcicum (strain 28A) TaxID=671987 RepID=R0KHW2_EXST2|nr:uncharacterized protein SETTUDRAFT_28244 [Exserohilum turcica Et28A]EOA87612.1 hypothetical protein SETTUDRAFT_28244 [Exserohilum turcica Et28A]
MTDNPSIMANGFTQVITMMMQNPPDPNEHIPLSNKKGTIFGTTITFLVISWLFVAFRLHTRLIVLREPGLDDLFVALAAVFHLVSTIAFLCCTNYGLGKHLIFVLGMIQPTMMWLYITNGAYNTTTGLIKISLLLQYLRLFREGIRRIVCIVLLVMVICWAMAFAFMAWFPCFPVSGFWDRTKAAKCYGYGYRSTLETKHLMLAFSATNMIFDVSIFAIPLTEYFRKDLRRRQVLAMTGLFTLGAIAVMMAILRLWSTFKHNASSAQSFDFVWWYPEVLIISSLEVSFAIMCASMPIFWPTVMISWGHIFVTNEVRVTSHERLGSVSQEAYELKRTESVKSNESTRILESPASDQGNLFERYYRIEMIKSEGLGVTHIEAHHQAPKELPL